jgi:tetratricopeptide (TPR) repeat protein
MPKKKPTHKENARKKPVRMFVLIGAGVLLVGAFEFYRSHQNPAPVLPRRPESMDANVAALIEDHIEAVKRDRSDPELHGKLGIAYEANELYPEALACFELAARLDPGDPVWRLHGAIALFDNGQFDPALIRLRKLTATHPDFAPAQQRLGTMLLDVGAFDDAEEAFRRTTTLLPTAADGYVGLAQVALARNDYPRAVANLEQALGLDSSYKMTHFLFGQAYRGLGRMEDAERELALGVNAAPRYLPDRMSRDKGLLVGGLAAQLSRGGKLIEAGRLDEAVSVLEAALRDRPNDTNVMNNLAVACLESKRYERALELLHLIRQADQNAFPTYINLASCLLRMNRPAEGHEHAQRAVDLAPHVSQAHFVLGRTLVGLGRPIEAIDALQEAIELDRRNPVVSLELGQAFMMVNRFPDARTQFEVVTQRAPGLLAGHVKLGTVCLRLGDLEAAKGAFESAQRLDPDDAGVNSLAREIARMRVR